jgi:DNA-binding NarL/FixJ family response regulator
MAKAYSLDLRERVFDLLAKGKSKLFIEETLGVATKTIQNHKSILLTKTN